jgi:hypothetical protein
MRDIDRIIQVLVGAHPKMQVRRLHVRHPGDDDGLWFFMHPDCEFQVQVESSTGMCPVLIETDESDIRITAISVADTVSKVQELLRLSAEQPDK